jgi:DNA polymerase-3 subunit gamma/tau
MIARSASGSFRDALGTLDQLVAFGGEQVKLEAVLELLGAADAELLFEAVDAVAAEDPKEVLLGVERMARSGRDPSQFARDLLGHLRHLLVTQTVGEVPNTFVVTATDADRLAAQAAAVGPATLIRTIDELAAALTAVREGDDARMAVEIALLKAARPDLDPSTEGLLRRIERLEQRGTNASRAAGPVAAGDPPPPAVAEASSGAVPPAAPPATATAPADEQEPEPVAEPESPVDAAEPESSDDADSPAGGVAGGDPHSGGRGAPEHMGEPAATGPAGQPTPVSDLDLDQLTRIWPTVLDKLRETSPALAATFDGARPVSMDEDGLKIGFPPDSTFNKRKAEAPEKRELAADALEAIAGTRLRPVYVLLDGEDDSAGENDTPEPAKMDEDALGERLETEFNAKEVS